jgi:hypothetical protein
MRLAPRLWILGFLLPLLAWSLAPESRPRIQGYTGEAIPVDAVRGMLRAMMKERGTVKK